MTSSKNWEFIEVAGPFGLTEGPAWDGNNLLFTDFPNSRILKYFPNSGETQVYRQKTNLANGLMLNSQGNLYACEAAGRCIACYYPDGNRVVVVDNIQGKSFNSPNDLAIDQKDCIWFTDSNYSSHWAQIIGPPELKHNSVYRADLQLNGSWKVCRMTYDTGRPNGLLVTPDLKTLYVAESNFEGNRELRAYPICSDGTLGSFTILYDFSPHRGIDGMCLDCNGNIVAAAGWERSGPGGMIYVFDPQGRILEKHSTPCDRPTNCSWGGDNLKTLFITSVCGRLYRTETSLTGWLLYP